MFFALPTVVAVVATYIQFVFLGQYDNPVFRPMVWNALEDLKSVIRRRMRVARSPTRQLAVYWTRLISGSASNTSTISLVQPRGTVTKQTPRLSDMCEVPAPTFPAAAFNATFSECSYSHQAYVNNLVVFVSFGGMVLLLVYLWRRLENIQRKFDSVNPGNRPLKEVHFVESNTGLAVDSADTDPKAIRFFGRSGFSPLFNSCEVQAASSLRWPTVVTTDSRLILPDVPHLNEATLDDCRVLNGGQKPIESLKQFKSSTLMIRDSTPALPWIEKSGALVAGYVAPNMMSDSMLIPATTLTVTSVGMNRETHIANPAVTRSVPLILRRPNLDVLEPLDQSISNASQLSGSTSPILSDPETPDLSREPNGADHFDSEFSHQQGAKLSPQDITREINAFEDSAAHPPRLLSTLVPESRAPWSCDAWGEDDRDMEVLSTIAQPPTPDTDTRTIAVNSDVDYEDQTIRNSDSTMIHDLGADDSGTDSINPGENLSVPPGALPPRPEGESYSWPSGRYARSQLTATPVSNATPLPDYESDRVFAAQLFTSRLRRPLETPLDTDMSQLVVPSGGELEDVTPALRRNENTSFSHSFSQPRYPLDLGQDPAPESASPSKSTLLGEHSSKSRVTPLRQPTAPSLLPGFTTSHAPRAIPRPAAVPASKQGTDQSVWAYPSDSNSRGLNSRSWRRGHRN